MHKNKEKTKINRIHPFVLSLNKRKKFVFLIIFNLSNVKLNESSDRPGVAQRVPGGLGSQIS